MVVRFIRKDAVKDVYPGTFRSIRCAAANSGEKGGNLGSDAKSSHDRQKKRPVEAGLKDANRNEVDWLGVGSA
jgi:hypothetical protein